MKLDYSYPQDLQKMIETVENLGEQSSNSAKILAFGAVLFDKYPRIGKMGKFLAWVLSLVEIWWGSYDILGNAIIFELQVDQGKY